MKVLIILILIFFSLSAFSQVKVSGYYSKDGTYVQPHYRSNPDGNPYNNWSFPGNTNPYTGKVATGDPATYLNNYYNRKSNNSSTYTPSNSLPDYTYPNTSINTTSYYVSSPKLNVRSGPSTSHTVLYTLNYLDNVQIISNSSYPWYKIQIDYYDYNTYSNRTTQGYVHSSFLTSNYSIPDRTYNLNDLNINVPSNQFPSNSNNYNSTSTIYYVTSNKLNIRSGPSTQYASIATLDFRDQINIISTLNAPWYKVEFTYYDLSEYTYKTSKGYMHSSYISFVEPVANEIPTIPNNAKPIIYHPFGEGKGKISVWTDRDGGYISVYVEDVYVGQITSYFTTAPDCSHTQILSIVRPAGTYKITAKSASQKWEGYVNIDADECLLQKLANK